MIVASGFLQEYIERVLGELDGPSAAFDRRLAARIKSYLTLGLVRVNRLPSEHPYWTGRSRRPAFASLPEFFEHEPDDDAAWVLLAGDLFDGRGADFVLRIRPRTRRREEALWAVAGIRWCRERAGADAGALFRLLHVSLPLAFFRETPDDPYARELVDLARRWRGAL